MAASRPAYEPTGWHGVHVVCCQPHACVVVHRSGGEAAWVSLLSRRGDMSAALYSEYKGAAPLADAADSVNPLELEHVVGFSGRWKNTLACHPTSDAVFVSALGAAVVVGDITDPHQQVFLRGHDGEVSVVAVSPTGSLIASGQVGSVTSPVRPLHPRPYRACCVGITFDDLASRFR